MEGKKKKKRENIIGSTSSKSLDENFLLNHIPGKYSIEKIKEELGNPNNFYESESSNTFENIDESDKQGIVVYEYSFINSRVIFSTLKESSSIISITIDNSDERKPIKTILSPLSNNDLNPYFKNAKIDMALIDSSEKLFGERYINWMYSALQTRHFNREYKHCTFTYICYDDVDLSNKNNFNGLVIDQICISIIPSICLILNFYED